LELILRIANGAENAPGISMKIDSLIAKIGENTGFTKKRVANTTAPILGDAVRFPYGPFRFRTRLSKGTEYTIQACTDLKTWQPIVQTKAQSDAVEHIDSDAARFSYRFYRLMVGETASQNVIGYASITLPPGFSMIANPFDTHATISDLIRDWPDGTTLNRFDTRLFKLAENTFERGKWSNPNERLLPGEGAIFFNPTADYKALSFVGEVMQGNLSVPIPSGFSIRSSLVPQPGQIVEDLGFPIANGDVIHLFDRERQKYMLHPFEEGKWTAGAPVVSVGEAFWVAKTDQGNWTRGFFVDTTES
jgi:hypothetical protein